MFYLFNLEDTQWIEKLQNLQPNWDNEGADPPSQKAINETQIIATLLRKYNISFDEVDADVLGGVAIYLSSKKSNRKAWINISNHGSQTIVMTDDGKIDGCVFDKNSIQDLKLFLEGEDPSPNKPQTLYVR